MKMIKYLPVTLNIFPFQLGDEKYAVFATQGPTLCFDPPLNYARDGVTEKVVTE